MTTKPCKAKDPSNCRYHGPIIDRQLYGIRHRLNNEAGKFNKQETLALIPNHPSLSAEAKTIAISIIEETFAGGETYIHTYGVVNNLEVAIIRRENARKAANKRDKTTPATYAFLAWEKQHETILKNDGWLEAARFAAYNPKPE